jgi:hypothetical protein
METIFISGKTNGLPREEVINKFNEAKKILESNGYVVLSPINNNKQNEGTLEQNLLYRMELLLSCNAIYFLDNWTESTESLIEYDMAVRLNKVIFVNKDQNKEQRYNLEKLKEAIHAITGLTFEEYTARSRKKEFVFARMLFAHYCFVVENIPILEIAGILKRDRATLIYMLNKYNDDVKYNPKFRELVNNIKKVFVEFN